MHESSLREVSTPALDDNSFSPEQWEAKGTLAPHAANIVMKVLYAARAYRWDLLWTIDWLARHMAEWSKVCDIKLKRCIAYKRTTEKFVMQVYVSIPIHLCNVAMFSDVDFARDIATSKSTLGGYAAIVGPNTWAPIAGICKSHNAVSHSSTVSDILALDLVLRAQLQRQPERAAPQGLRTQVERHRPCGWAQKRPPVRLPLSR